MTVNLKRVYDEPKKDDGYRVLVDRLWPRGLTKQKAKIDEWARDIAPTNELRKWFHQNDSEWQQFQKRYKAYLRENKGRIEPIIARARKEKVTLVYASKRQELHNATVLKDYIEKHIKKAG
jgi:uncharacterized protein YeaO (DUF488 family)